MAKQLQYNVTIKITSIQRRLLKSKKKTICQLNLPNVLNKSLKGERLQ